MPSRTTFTGSHESRTAPALTFEGDTTFPDGARWTLDTDANRLAWMAYHRSTRQVWSLLDAQGEPLALLGLNGDRVSLALTDEDGTPPDPRTLHRITAWLDAYQQHRAQPSGNAPGQAEVTLEGEAWEKAGILRTPLFGGRFLSSAGFLDAHGTDRVRQALQEDLAALNEVGLKGWEPSLLEQNQRDVQELTAAHKDRTERMNADGIADSDRWAEAARQKADEAALTQRLIERRGDRASYRAVDALLHTFVRSSAAWATPEQVVADLNLAVHWADTMHDTVPASTVSAWFDAVIPEAAAQSPEKAQAVVQGLFDAPDWNRDRSTAFDAHPQAMDRATKASQASALLVAHGADGPLAKALFEQASQWAEPLAQTAHPFQLYDSQRPEKGLERWCPWAAAIAVGHADWVLERQASGAKPLGLAAALAAVQHGEPVNTVHHLAQPWLVAGEDQVGNAPHRRFVRETLKACAQADHEGRAIPGYASWLLVEAKALSEPLLRCENVSRDLLACARHQAPEILDDFALSRACRNGLWQDEVTLFDHLDAQRRAFRQRAWEARDNPEALAALNGTATSAVEEPASHLPPALRNLQRLADALDGMKAARDSDGTVPTPPRARP